MTRTCHTSSSVGVKLSESASSLTFHLKHKRSKQTSHVFLLSLLCFLSDADCLSLLRLSTVTILQTSVASPPQSLDARVASPFACKLPHWKKKGWITAISMTPTGNATTVMDCELQECLTSTAASDALHILSSTQSMPLSVDALTSTPTPTLQQSSAIPSPSFSYSSLSSTMDTATGVSTHSTLPDRPSVHLQLQNMSLNEMQIRQKIVEVETNVDKDVKVDGTASAIVVSQNTVAVGPAAPAAPAAVVVTEHSFVDAHNQTWKALNTAKHKFRAFLKHSGALSTTIEDSTLKTLPIKTTKVLLLEEEEEIDSDNSRYENSQTKMHINVASDNKENINDAAVNRRQTDSTTKNSVIRSRWRELWKEQRLLADRTELLAVFPSDTTPLSRTNMNNIQNNINLESEQNSSPMQSFRKKPKRGGFSDLLFLYTERFVAILQDEQEELFSQLEQQNSTSVNFCLKAWLQEHYGHVNTLGLEASAMSTLSDDEQTKRLRHFLEWFRQYFPYFYDRCESCGSSYKKDMTAAAAAAKTVSPEKDGDKSSNNDDSAIFPEPSCLDDNDEDEDDSDDEQQTNTNGNEVINKDLDEDKDKSSFIGYVYPNASEAIGKASRTELYRCHKCHEFTRFPRFNSAHHVCNSQRGRCGEYSMLLFRLLRALNHESRWVVDWSDHVWAEVCLEQTSTATSTSSSLPIINNQQSDQNSGHKINQSSRRWIHLDPCEAAVNENLLYQSWGKKQTFILAFYALRTSFARSQQNNNVTATSTSSCSSPLIEDVTQSYTSDTWINICQRRDESEKYVQTSIQNAIQRLDSKLRNDIVCRPHNVT